MIISPIIILSKLDKKLGIKCPNKEPNAATKNWNIRVADTSPIEKIIKSFFFISCYIQRY